MSHMPFVRDDGGREAAGFKGKAGDCVVRAVAIATGKSYLEVYNELSSQQRTQRVTTRSQRRSSARNGVSTRRAWFKRYMTALGWVWRPTMFVGVGCKVHLVDGELPMGTLIVAVSKHYTTVIDRVVHDTHDPQRTTFHIEGGIVKHTSERCVYGYWQKSEED